ncbi:hypothetical protein ACJJTC_011190 [Scirpophaga incertulas]
MEEVDSIILHFLRQLKVNISEDIKSLCDLPVEIIIEAASKCLGEINHSLKLPTQLPSGISHRIEVASQIASLCKDMGYKNDVGYQTFLYYNEAELRQIFMFLIEHLPSETKHDSTKTSTDSNKPILFQDIATKISEELNSIWIPYCCKAKEKNIIGDFVLKSDHYLSPYLKTLNESKLLESLKQIKYKNHAEEKEIKIKNDENELTENSTMIVDNKKSLKELKELNIVLRQKLDTLESERNVMDVEYSQVQKSCERVNTEMKNVIAILESIGITDIEQDINENIFEKLQHNLSILHRTSEELTSNILSEKMDLEKFNNSQDSVMSERDRCKTILQSLKQEAKNLKEEYEQNEEVKKQLKKSYEMSKGGCKRSVYTKRILEIISNVDKQNMEIKKILEDTRQLQKEINTLEGQLDRCFSIADETLFRDAKKDDQAKKAYKLLALLHSECSTIVSLVNDTGSMARDIVDLEDNIKTEKAKRTEDTLEKINLDLTKMQQESIVIL